MYATSISIKKKRVDATCSAISYRSSFAESDFGSSLSIFLTKLLSISKDF